MLTLPIREFESTLRFLVQMFIVHFRVMTVYEFVFKGRTKTETNLEFLLNILANDCVIVQNRRISLESLSDGHILLSKCRGKSYGCCIVYYNWDVGLVPFFGEYSGSPFLNIFFRYINGVPLRSILWPSSNKIRVL